MLGNHHTNNFIPYDQRNPKPTGSRITNRFFLSYPFFNITMTKKNWLFGLNYLTGNRSIIFNEDDEIPLKELKECIALALTYHLNKKLKKRAKSEK